MLEIDYNLCRYIIRKPLIVFQTAVVYFWTRPRHYCFFHGQGYFIITWTAIRNSVICCTELSERQSTGDLALSRRGASGFSTPNWKAAQVFGLDCLKLHASFPWHPTWIPGFTRMPWYLWLVLYIISGRRDLGFYVSSEGLVILTRYWNPLTQNYYHTDDLHSFKTWEEGFCCHQQMCVIL